jgi:outer membrane protein assembly factor BamB
MDDRTIYLPLEDSERGASEDACVPASLTALARDSGLTRWTTAIATCLPPVLTQGSVVVASGNEITALDPARGDRQWSITLDLPVRTPLLARGSLLLAMLEGDQLVAVDIPRRVIAWRRSVGEAGPLKMTADDQAVYVATDAGRISRILLADGSMPWERQLSGTLSEPTVDGDRLFVGSAKRGLFWCLDVRTGKNKWAFLESNLLFGGGIVGSAVQGDLVYVASQDNIVRALNRGSGNQRWKSAITTRPLFPPLIFAGVVAVVGQSPALSTFRADTGAAVSTWMAPQADAVLQGAPLIADPRPLAVSMVVVFGDGQVVGLRSTELVFKEPPLTPLTVLPGRALPRETLPGDPPPR